MLCKLYFIDDEIERSAIRLIKTAAVRDHGRHFIPCFITALNLVTACAWHARLKGYLFYFILFIISDDDDDGDDYDDDINNDNNTYIHKAHNRLINIKSWTGGAGSRKVVGW